MKHTISGFDHTLSAWLHERPKSLRYLYGWITLIGHPAVVMFVASIAIVFGFGLSLPIISHSFIAAIIAYALSAGLKLVLRRPRPSTPYAAGMLHTSFSFPSGHAFGSLVVYGLIAYVAARYLSLFWAALAVWGLWSLIILIGISRVYLGAHFVLDVIGGWLISGVALLWIINYIAR
jgi:membrane-associated phospholipid phosphatase